MGLSTFYHRWMDMSKPLSEMSKNELKWLDEQSGYGNAYEKDGGPYGWRVPLTLHNNDLHVLVFWHGQLVRLRDAQEVLRTGRMWNRYKYAPITELTFLKRVIDWNLRDLKKAMRHKEYAQAKEKRAQKKVSKGARRQAMSNKKSP